MSYIHRKETPFFDEKFTFIYWLIKFEILEACFDQLVLLIPWLKFPHINPHPDFTAMVNEEKNQCQSSIRYEIYPYNEKLSKLSAIEFFLIFFLVGLFISLGISMAVYHGVANSFQSIIAVGSFGLGCLITFILSMSSAMIYFAFDKYRSKNNCYLITSNRIYHIFRKTDLCDVLGKKFITPETRTFSIRGLWHPSSRIPESYKYCNITAGIVKFYVDDPEYVTEIITKEFRGSKNRNGNHPSLIQKFPNDLSGKETAPFYMYLVEPYTEVRDNLRTWSENLRHGKKN